MHLDIQARSFKLTSALSQAVKRSLMPLNRQMGVGLKRVQVRLSDVNGQRGGVDKHCLIVMTGGGRKTVVAQALHADMYQAIAQAGRRAERAFSHLKIKRKRRSLKNLG